MLLSRLLGLKFVSHRSRSCSRECTRWWPFLSVHLHRAIVGTECGGGRVAVGLMLTIVLAAACAPGAHQDVARSQQLNAIGCWELHWPRSFAEHLAGQLPVRIRLTDSILAESDSTYPVHRQVIELEPRHPPTYRHARQYWFLTADTLVVVHRTAGQSITIRYGLATGALARAFVRGDFNAIELPDSVQVWPPGPVPLRVSKADCGASS
jgi:hypothetical protein